MWRFFDNDNNDITDELTSSRLYCRNPACLGEPWCSAWGICTATEQEAKQTASLPVPAEEATSGCGMEEVIDRIMADIDFSTLQELTTPAHPDPQAHSSSTKPAEQQPKQCFAPPKSREEVEAARKASMPKKTREDMQYCMRVWKDWRECSQDTIDITAMTKVELDEAEWKRIPS